MNIVATARSSASAHHVIEIEAVEAETIADFDGLGLAAPNIEYRARIESSTPSAATAEAGPSLESTATGKALGPRGSCCHHPSRGPRTFAAAATQLKC